MQAIDPGCGRHKGGVDCSGFILRTPVVEVFTWRLHIYLDGGTLQVQGPLALPVATAKEPRIILREAEGGAGKVTDGVQPTSELALGGIW